MPQEIETEFSQILDELLRQLLSFVALVGQNPQHSNNDSLTLFQFLQVGVSLGRVHVCLLEALLHFPIDLSFLAALADQPDEGGLVEVALVITYDHQP